MRQFAVLSAFLLLIFSNTSYAQCGCTACPLLVADLTPAMIPIEVSGVINDDLSDPLQGVCEVHLEFTHDDVGDWTIDLISPAGQSIQLKGPYTLCGFSDGDVWRVKFVRCDSTAVPDPPNAQQPAGYSAVWDNCEFENTFDVEYTGSYYPTTGCLEDFNTGPVNGTWIINSFDNREGDEGQLLGFQLVFCDPGDVDCETIVCQDPVIANIVASDSVVCPDENVILDGSSSIGVGLEFFWSAISGGIVSGANTPMAEISGPGRYVLEVRNLGPEGVYCRGYDTLDIALSSLEIPEAEILDLFLINCDSPEISIVATITATSGSDEFEWSTTEGNIVSGQGTTEIRVDAAGEYSFHVYNGEGCGNDYFFTVEEDFLPPTIEIDFESLNCNNDLMTVLDLNPGLAMETYVWSGPDIHAVNMNEQSPEIGQVGMYSVTVTAMNGCVKDTTIEVVYDTITPEIEIEIVLDPDCTNPLQTLIVTANDLLQSYFWLGPDINGANETDAVVEVETAGTYVVEVAAENGCPKIASIEVEALEPWPPNLMLFDSMITCYRSEIILGPTDTFPLYEFLWTGPGISTSNETQKNPVVNVAGNYTLVVTNDRDCFFADNVEVQWDTLSPVYDTVPYTFDCDDEFALIGIIPAGSVSVTWTGPGILPANQNDLIVTARSSALYTVNIIGENGCETVQEFNVVKQGVIPDLTVTGDTLTCNKMSIMLEASSSASVDYLWTGPGINSTNETIANPTVTLPGTYDIVITDDFGCKNSTSIFVPIDTATISVDTIVSDTISCSDLTVQIQLTVTGGDAIYTWIGPGINGANENEQNPTVDQGGIYSVILEANNGCQSQASIEVEELRDIPSLMLSSDILSCLIDSVEIISVAPEAISYNWTGPDINATNENNPNPEVTIPGLYILEITDGNGCKNTEQIVIDIDSIRPTINLSSDTLTCLQTNLMLENISDGIGFLWSGPGINAGNESMQSPTIDRSGLYEVVATGANGCARTEMITVSIDTVSPSNSLSASIITCALPDVVLELTTNGESAIWSGPDIDGTNRNELQPEISVPGEYEVIVTAKNGCNSISTVMVGIDTLRPTAVINSSSITNTITCEDRSIQLDGLLSSTLGSITYTWSRVGGGGVSPTDVNLSTIVIQNSGTYILQIEDGINGCLDEVEIEITEDGNFPSIRLAPYEELNCERRSIFIDATTSFGASTIEFEWTGTGIVGASNVGLIEVNAPGNYSLSIIDDFNNCQTDTLIIVSENVVLPEISMAIPAELNCNTSQVQLNFYFKHRQY